MIDSSMKCALCSIVAIIIAAFAVILDDVILRNLLLSLAVISIALAFRYLSIHRLDKE
jgi:hypothetical protein